MDYNKILLAFLDKIKDNISLFSYNIWFKDLTIDRIEDNKLYMLISLKDKQIYDQHIKMLKDIYYNMIEEALYDVTGNTYEIIFITSEVKIEPITEEKVLNKQIINNELNINNNMSIINDNSSDYRKYKYYNKFNPDYTFDSFVVGDSNRLAYSAAKAVAEKPGKRYNPYFIYGKSGLGKTHLMHAIGNYIINNFNINVLYITAEDFKNDYRLISNSKDENNLSYLEAFRKKYRDVDVLMIDDIQFLENAYKTQQEFTNTFYSLQDNDKQIIIASDTSIEDLKKIEDRLKTRFSWGLTESINQPEVDLKKEIILNKVKISNFDFQIDEEVIDYIATNCGNNIRNLEGTITRLAFYKMTYNVDRITLDVAINSLEEYTIDANYKTNSVSKIISVIEKYYNLDSGILKGKRNKKIISKARSIGMYLSREMTNETLERIGLEFGGRNHSTVLHSWNLILDEIKKDSKLKNEIMQIKEKISE